MADAERDAALPMDVEREPRTDDDIGEASPEGDETGRAETAATVEGITTLQLPADRVDTAALESLFTERTEGDADQDDDEGDEGKGEVDGEQGSPQDGHPEDGACDEATEKVQLDASIGDSPRVGEEDVVAERPPPTTVVPEQALSSRAPSRATTPTMGVEPQLSPTRPSVPARPPRPSAIVPPPPAPPAPAAAPSSPLQLLTFDVGGRLFRCKASLIAKFPAKRLHHVVTCGCEQIDHATFFIDRNPQHFELILDWYRTGKCAHPLPPHLHEDTLKDDARYFDLYDELFPPGPAPALPPRVKAAPQPQQQDTPPPSATALPRLPDRPARSVVPATPMFSPPQSAASPADKPVKSQPSRTTKHTSGVFRFSKRDVRIVAPTSAGTVATTWFSVREHEHLVVESVRGAGKLLVRVTDATGMARVFVDQAVLFDSRSWFYLEDDGRARLQHCVLPGNHVYSFWMEPSLSDPAGAPSPPPPSKPIKQQGGKTAKATSPAAVTATASVVTPPQLEVVFRLVSTFSGADEVDESDVELTAMLRAKGRGWGDSGSASVAPTPTDSATLQCLFLPPLPAPAVPPPVEHHRQHDDTDALDERDAIAEEIRAMAAKERALKTLNAAQDAVDAKGLAGSLKRGGAAIALPLKAAPNGKPPPPGHGNEKVTVYQPIPPAAATPRSPAKQQAPTYSAQQPRQFRQR